jgi:isochorismate synthase
VRAVPEAEAYAAGVAQAVRRIRAGAVDKVVLARTLELEAERAPELRSLLARLAARNPLGFNFAVPLGSGRALVGASPELLVSRSAGVLRANPLAGSLPRSRDPVEDMRRAQALLESPKDLEEHRIVVDAVVQALRPLCPKLQVPAHPSLLHTSAMWHLSTEITGHTEADALTLALALHPTPAVCGFPRHVAHELIGEIEPFDRGFYAGAFGWSDARGDGEWVVSLRCAEVEGRRLRLYAGAGVVADSQPEAEVAETAAKFRTMLDALGLAHELAQPKAREAA